jgi:phosphoribosylaminoimidazole carboxylase / phosphoribosylaminoimidazole-succinocarboxamide synthase
MMIYKKGKKIAEGKTKTISAVIGHPNLVILGNKDDTTAFNDKKFTKKITSKGEYCTTVTCKIFELLKEAGLPVAYVSRFSPTEFVAEKTIMIQLEKVGRRLAIGSYLKRNPWKKQDPPLRFHQLVTELFLKTDKGKLVVDGETIISGLTADQDDPFLVDDGNSWKLFHPWMPTFLPEADLKRSIPKNLIAPDMQLAYMDDVFKKCFLFLEGLFRIFGFRFGDIKIEFGITKDGRVVISDVIDPDSWRLLSWDWQHFSKQAHRDGEEVSEIERKYGYLARMSEFFRIPRQALVVWCGSPNDQFQTLPEIPGINPTRVDLSGHKKTFEALSFLEKIMMSYPDGGVIIDKVGRSNGLGPILSTHTCWPVISLPADWKESPQNIWSHLDMPSEAPLLTCLRDNEALLAALNILADKNPSAYMHRQYAIEKLDRGY